MHSHQSIVQWRGPYRGKVLVFGQHVLAHLPEVGKGSGNSAPMLADRWQSAVWLGKSDLTDEHLLRADEGVVCAGSVRRLAAHSWSEANLRAVVDTPQKPKSTTLDIPPAADPLAPPPAVPEVHEDEEEPTGKPAEDEEMQGEPSDTTMTPGAESSNRGEKRTETQEDTSVKTTEKRTATFADEPVKRSLTMQTDTKNAGVFMPVEIEDLYLLKTANTLLSDETGVETKSLDWSFQASENLDKL